MTRKFNKIKEPTNIIILLTSIVVFLSPFVVNYTILPKGFELAKVHFLNISTAVILLVFLFLLFSKKIKLEKDKLRKALLVCLIIIVSFVITTILSSHSNISLYGNSFRDQGLIFYTLITLAAAVCYLTVNKFNQQFIIFALFFSAFIQALIGISQYISLLQSHPDLADDGYWVNGTFGQANFYSTLLVLGFIAGFFVLNLINSKVMKYKFKIPLLTLATTFILIIVIANILSYSVFGWITMFIALILLLLYKYLKKTIFYRIFIVAIILAAIGSVYSLTRIEDNLRIDIWRNSLVHYFNQLNSKPIYFVFGFGFDTLGNVFKDAGFFKGVFIDRGHNIFIDIVMQVGIIGIGLSVFLIITILRKLKQIILDPTIFIFFFMIFIYILKTLIHEFSAIHTYLLFILVGILLGRISDLKQEQKGLD